MKRTLLITLIVTTCISVVYAFTQSSSSYVPIIVERTTLENSIASLDTVSVQNPGKIFVYENNLFIVEQYYGVHVFDNSNPASPVKRGFIRILGCTDIAVKGPIMYASSAVDLVTLNIGNISNVTELSREKNVLSEIVSPYGTIPAKYSLKNRPSGTIIVAWKKD
ncbi:MAG: hypothetical protein PF481_09560 [Bacteroidales bacterium]|jgi:hypothetical protein|nr:hypothetical protein [Bacteroidales bacterium]